jgi:hypothetical protein
MAAAHQNQRRQHDELGGRGGASSIAIGFDGTSYSEAGRESSIAIIGGGVVDSVAASICGSATDLVAASICCGATDSVAVVRHTRWQDPLAAPRHYDLLGRF